MEIEKMDSISSRGKVLIVESRLRDRGRIEKAISTQDELRKKSKGWDGAKEIRKWRDAR
jgi:hypothetical protein